MMSRTKLQNLAGSACSARSLQLAVVAVTSVLVPSLPGCSKGGGDGHDWGGDADDLQSNDPALIDNLDDGDGFIVEVGGRRGAWYVYNDMADGLSPEAQQVPAASANFVPSSGGADSTAFCAKTSGSGFASWGAGIGLDLNDDSEGQKAVFDASLYTGITFMARGNTTIRFSAMTAAVLPQAEGGSCVETPEAACYDAHGTGLALGPQWQQFSVSFAQLQQEGWGAPKPFTAAALIGLQFQVAAGTVFDFAVDTIHFY